MKKIGLNLVLVLVSASLAACSTTFLTKSPSEAPQQAPVAGAPVGEVGTPEVQQDTALPSVSDSSIGGTSIGGAVERAMDETDKTKMLHAMDKAPGKSTHWVNAHTQIEYTVTPTKKVRIEDKNYCRQYQMTAVYANDKEQSVQGVACIASDGNWHTLQS